MNVEKKYYKDYPIIVGLAGKAASGKTSVAETIVPKAKFSNTNDGIAWDHIFFALPLYEIASIKRTIQGNRQKDRQLFAIHQVLYDLYGGTALGAIPDYKHFIDLVEQIYNLPIEKEPVKPRSFLQKAGDLCRAYDSECFAKWAVYKAHKIHRSALASFGEDDEEVPMGVIISDVRFENEAQKIINQPNGIVIYFDASEDVRKERMLKRDGHSMTTEQSLHRSENEGELVKAVCSAIIDTDLLNVEEQTNKTLEIVNNFINVHA